MSKLIDSHTHIQFSQFDADRAEVIKRAFDKDVWMVNAGSDKKNSIQAVELADKYKEGVYATVGQHPGEGEHFEYEFFKKLAVNPKVVAIGECGLDYYRVERGGWTLQKEIFIKHIDLAHDVKKPLMIHCRNGANSHMEDAFGDLIKILSSRKHLLNNPNPGINHFFTGTKEDAKKLLDLEFFFTFGGLITFSRDLDEVIKYIPLDRIMVETDAPYVTPAPYRGKRNEPAYVVEVAKKMAEIKNIAYEEICEITTQNAKKIFNLT